MEPEINIIIIHFMFTLSEPSGPVSIRKSISVKLVRAGSPRVSKNYNTDLVFPAGIVFETTL